MSYLSRIEHRHSHDGWKDAGFLVLAVVMVALAVAGMSARGLGDVARAHAHEWTLTVIEGPIEISQ